MRRNTTAVLDTDHEGDITASTAVDDETVSVNTF